MIKKLLAVPEDQPRCLRKISNEDKGPTVVKPLQPSSSSNIGSERVISGHQQSSSDNSGSVSPMIFGN